MLESDMIDQLRRYGEAVEVAVATRPERAPVRAKVTPVTLRAAAAILVAVAIAGAALALRRDASEVGSPEITTDSAGGRGTWETFPAAPIPSRIRSAAVVATDDELVVWGGWEQIEGTVATGAALSFDDLTWRTLAPSPLEQRQSPVAVWTGDELVVWGGFDDEAPGGPDLFDGATYDPATDTWRALPATAWGAQKGRTGAVWTGEELVLTGVIPGPGAELVSDTFALDPDTGRWRPLTRSPATTSEGEVTAAWTGDMVAVVSVRADGGPVTIDRLDPSGDGTWSETVTTDLTDAEAVNVGQQLVLVQRGEWDGPDSPPQVVAARLFDTTTGDMSTVPPPGTIGGSELGDLPLTTVGGVVVAGGVYLDVETRTWHAMADSILPTREEASAAASGDWLYVWGGDECGELCGSGTDIAMTDPGEGLAWHR
jgi:hypothetical protein